MSAVLPPHASPSSRSSIASRAHKAWIAVNPASATGGFTSSRCSHTPSAVLPQTISEPPSPRSWSAATTGDPESRSGSSGAADSRAVPSIATSLTTGPRVAATIRSAPRVAASSRSMRTSTPRPARAAGRRKERFAADPRPTVCRRDPRGNRSRIARTAPVSKPICPSVTTTT